MRHLGTAPSQEHPSDAKEFISLSRVLHHGAYWSGQLASLQRSLLSESSGLLDFPIPCYWRLIGDSNPSQPVDNRIATPAAS